MEKSTVDTLTTVGKAVNVAAGHVGEMAGAATEAAGKATGCPVAQTAGRAMQAAGKAWSDKAVSVANRDRGRLTQ
jgi:uncharacterized protein YjbJ (UPF0337 family)